MLPGDLHINLGLRQTLTAVKVWRVRFDGELMMGWLERSGYRLDLGRLCKAALLLALVFVVLRFAFRDSLTLGYAMVVPSYVFLSAAFEGARTERSSFRDFRGWAETAVAVAGAVGVGYLGFSLWSIGY